jgi:hypothetical protein
MMGEEGHDALLQRFLNVQDQGVAQECLDRLLTEHVEPLVRDITRYKFRSRYASGSSQEEQDEEDIRSEVLLQLISRLRDLRASPTKPSIENFRGYVATTAYNAYHKSMRVKYPERSRLKNRIRYLVNHRREFAMWRDEHEDFLCGLAASKKPHKEWNAGAPSPEQNFEEFLELLPTEKNIHHMKLAELVHAVLTWRGQPILIDELVGIVAEMQGIRELQPASSYCEKEEGPGVSVCELLPDRGTDVVTMMEHRAYLEELWLEICQLPLPQRVALLLNLRDAKACDGLELFTLTGIASLRRIAEVVAWPVEDFATVWNKLPLEDAAIAASLGVTRQQVINLRKSARERLARRMVGPRNRARDMQG